MTSVASIGMSTRYVFGMFLVGLFLLLGGVPLDLAGQVNPAAQSPQMRHFWHVFLAYASAWVLLFGWVVSIVRRLRRVEERLK